jgi:phenylacetate-coenzyme A ligase PaaK-like adenylate-forming protein
MSEKNLWKRHCSELVKPFPDQVEYNQQALSSHFARWKETKLAKHLCPDGVERFEDIPLTTYQDYPILHEFRRRIEAEEQSTPRNPGEGSWDYYQRISHPVAKELDLEGWLGEPYYCCLKTSGSTGESKWFAYSEIGREIIFNLGPAMTLISCSKEPGSTTIRKGDKFLNIGVPVPYGLSVAVQIFTELLESVPPALMIEGVSDMQKKMGIFLETIEQHPDIALLAAPASFLDLMGRYFTDPEAFFKDQYRSMTGIPKLILYLKYLGAKRKKKLDNMKSLLPNIKGVIIGGWDGTFFKERISSIFGVDPFNLYACSDTLFPMMGRPHRKFDFYPELRYYYPEFLGMDDKVRTVEEVQKGENYELVITCFGSLTTRYKMGDIFEVIEHEEDGMPVFRFAGRQTGMFDIHGYFRISEAIIRDVLDNIGLPPTDHCSVFHETHPKDQICILIEKESNFDYDHLTKKVFDELQVILSDFKNYVNDFRISDPSSIIKFELLPKGTYRRYTMKRQKEGVPLGQNKPPKVIGPERKDIVNLLRNV